MLEDFIDCENPMYGKTGIFLGVAAGGMKALNEFVLPSANYISDGAIFVTSILGGVLLLFKIVSVRTGIKFKRLEIKQKKLDIEQQELDIKRKKQELDGE